MSIARAAGLLGDVPFSIEETRYYLESTPGVSFKSVPIDPWFSNDPQNAGETVELAFVDVTDPKWPQGPDGLRITEVVNGYNNVVQGRDVNYRGPEASNRGPENTGAYHDGPDNIGTFDDAIDKIAVNLDTFTPPPPAPSPKKSSVPILGIGAAILGLLMLRKKR